MMISTIRLCLIFLLPWFMHKGASDTSLAFVRITTCSCVGQITSYKCTSHGAGFTVWSGSAFMCTAGEITLTHIRFTTASGFCNGTGGAIVAQGLVINGNAYTSQLNVTMSAGLVGRTVTCTLDGNELTQIGNDTLQLTSTPFLTPNKIVLNDVGPDQISFTWSNVDGQEGCKSFRYRVSSESCGTCTPTTTTSNTSTCTKFRSLLLNPNNTCNFSVQSVVCDNLAGNVSHVAIQLKVPNRPTIHVIPLYLNETSSLIEITATFNIVEPFRISDDPVIDGSATSYTIVYSDSISGMICYSATIMASSCINGSCNHTLEVSKSACPPSTNISVTVFATNILGNGYNSVPVIQDGINKYVDVIFDPKTKRVHCQFNQPSVSGLFTNKTCSVAVTYGRNCDEETVVYPNSSSSNPVITPPIEFTDGILEYCLLITAISKNMTIKVERRVVSIDSRREINSSALVAVIVVFVAIGLTTVITTLVVYITYKRNILQKRWIKFKIPPPRKLTEAFEVFETHKVKILGVNTNLLHTDVSSDSQSDNGLHLVYYVTCKCERVRRHELLSLDTLNEVETIKEEDLGNGLLEITIKFALARDNASNIIKSIEDRGITIVGVNTQHKRGEVSVECSCSKSTKKEILKSIQEKFGDVTDGSVSDHGTSEKRRIKFWVRNEALAFASALKIFDTCEVNITEVNPDYILGYDPSAAREVWDASNYIECSCPKSKREKLFEELLRKKAVNSEFFEGPIGRSDTYEDYCLVKFSVFNEKGSLVKALDAFVDLKIDVIGVNTINCPLEALQHQVTVLYREVKLQFARMSDAEKLNELTNKLNATGIAIAKEITDDDHSARMSILVMIMEDEITVGVPQRLKKVFDTLGIPLLNGDKLDPLTSSSYKSVSYKLFHVDYQATNSVNKKLLNGLKSTGDVIVRHNSVVGNRRRGH